MREENNNVQYLEKAFRTEKPLAKLVRTPSAFYLYDTGTNKILECEEPVYELLQGLLTKEFNRTIEEFVSGHGEDVLVSTAEEIAAAIRSENILQLKKASTFGLSDHFHDFREILNSSMQSINLEVTQECQNRCVYCIYQEHYTEKRNFGNKNMSFEVAQKAIRFLNDHSHDSESVSVGFYGGEPLLRFPFIKDCVEYAKQFIKGRELIFNITTNALLVTPEIAEYLLNEGFSILVSLDGPQEIHDLYRKDAEGKGTFERTFKGLKTLSEKYTEIKRGLVSINAVYGPPFSAEKIDKINNFVKETQWLQGVRVLINYPNRHSIPFGLVAQKDLAEDKSVADWSYEKYRKDFNQTDVMPKGQVERKFARIIQRPVIPEPVDNFSLNGCCVPGQRKSYITTEGSIQVCEKISSLAPPIGNVYSGFDFETIKRVYIDEYAKESLGNCSGCWGLRMCDVCYIHAYNENGSLDMERKTRHCRSTLYSLEKSLMNFIAIMEENPGKLDYLNQFVIK